MLVQDSVSLESDVPEKMAGFLVADTFYAFVSGEEITQLHSVMKGLNEFSHPETTFLLKEVPRMDYI